MNILLHEQSYFKISAPSLSASLEYKRKVEIFEKIDRMLVDDGLENHLKTLLIKSEMENDNPTFGLSEQLKYQRKISQCLRVNIAKAICGCSFRMFSERLSDSNLLQWFCRFDDPDTIKLPGKSTLNELVKLIPKEYVSKLTEHLLTHFGNAETSLKKHIDLSSLYVDSTCVKLNIHHPIDWVLLKDAVKSISKTIKTIRMHGLKHRINPPESFIRKANRLTIEMSNTSSLRRAEAKAKRKKILRKLKSLLRVVEKHGQRYLRILNESWSKSDLSRTQAEQISLRLVKILDNVDDIIFQAHERIIGERSVKNKKKILSLYEQHAQVYKRGKAGADVEFGLQLFIAETEQGLIADFQLREHAPQNDAKFIKPCLERLIAAGLKPEDLTGDRGFVAKRVDQYLNKNKIRNYIYPKGSGKSLVTTQHDFKQATKRRSQTESRIGILKNNFIGNAIKAKGFRNQDSHIAWAVLSHNLWVLARMPVKVRSEQLVA